MKNFVDFLNTMEDREKRARMEDILQHITNKFPELKREIKWNQPMFTDHNTFIIAFSVAKNHISISPETKALDHFDEQIKQAGYERTKMLFKIKWTDKINFDLLDAMIDYNIKEKKNMTRFWR